MRRFAVGVLMLCATTVSAEVFTCTLTPECAADVLCDATVIDLSFSIDPNQFVDPQDPSDPPRRKVTRVTFGDRVFEAEPFVLGDVRGFWVDSGGSMNVMFVTNSDGSAKYNDADGVLIGICRRET